MSDNIKVVVKVRPLISREIEDKLPPQWRVNNNTLYQLDQNGRDYGQAFTFDKVYDQETETSDVYNDVAKPIVQAATAGFNGTIFAYGQTSSGKTYTMAGNEASPGIIPLSVLNLFDIIKSIPDRDFLVRVSYIEIYNETVKDLLDMKKENIKVHENYDGQIKVDASYRVTTSPDEVLEAMREGEANRQTGSTNMNEKSSRSHSIFQITVESREHIEGTEEAGCVNVSQLNLVDLAGSERAGQTGATGIRFKEGTHINKSLSALALVIKQLSEDPNKFANYRDSKLTRILQNSLGGNAKTSIICAITPAALEETISTLQFATRAKSIKNKPEVNAVATDATMIQTLTKQLSRLQSELEIKKNVELMLENKINVEQDLQNKIANLQKMILNGFGQRSSMEWRGARSKQLPRRITISTLHSIDEDPAPAVPRFCTPTLKYNPLTLQRVEPAPPPLASLPEEPARAVTPPRKDKKVYFSGEVIEIDSDDDHDSTNSTIPTCSPYHECQKESKTPPCILRKNLHRAEKNYKEIVEFTEREKLFQPDVVELMEQLEMSTNMTAQLKDEIEILKKNSKDRDLEMEHLLFKIKKSEEEMNAAKMELETYAKELTDKEVSYDILKKKAALREQELLSLLEEQKVKKCEDIGKLPAKPVEKEPYNFMDMSKDISLVNSDNESSVVIPNEDDCDQLKALVSSLQDQLIARGQSIMQLEANVASQKKSIEFLEQSSQQLEIFLDEFKEKNASLENENKLYKSNIDLLNVTIQSQKENLQKAHDDIATCTATMQELQMKLTNKDNLLNVSLADEVLTDMKANEEKVFANNDNMKNIIHSFKLTIENRNKEMELLKEETTKLKDKVASNINTINTLMREKSAFSSIEQELKKNLEEFEDTKLELYELNKEQMLKIDHLNETNQNLLRSLSEHTAKEQQYLQLNKELNSKLDEMSCKVLQIEEDLNEKNDVIASLNKINDDKQEYEDHAKSALGKLKNVITILSGDIQTIPDFIEDCVNLFNTFSSGLCVLEEVATETVSAKSVIVKQNEDLKFEIINLRNKHDIKNSELQHEINQLNKTTESNLSEITILKDSNKQLLDEIDFKYKKEVSDKSEEYAVLLNQCNVYKEELGKLSNDLLQKQEIISTFNEKETELHSVINDLQNKLCPIDSTLKSEKVMLESKEETLMNALLTIDQLKNELHDKTADLTAKNQQIDDILNKVTTVSNQYNVTDNFTHENGDMSKYNIVMMLLNNIISHQKTSENNIEEKLSETQKKLELLLKANESLKSTVSGLEGNNKLLVTELEKNNSEKENLCEHISATNNRLDQLKKDLKEKIDLIEVMKNKAQACNNQVVDLDISLNQKIQDLRLENENLKACLRKSVENEKPSRDANVSDQHQDSNQDKFVKSPKKNVKAIKAPPSLLTICCNKIVDVMDSEGNESNLTTPTSSDTQIHNSAKAQGCISCETMSLELRILQQEKCSLLGILEQTEKENKDLLIEQEKIRRELRLLLEPAIELQKKLSSHKTNLSILTATTYAENRSLKSQVLALKHHHSRLLNVCQGDIPEFKKQLRELFLMLKDDYNTESQNAIMKRFSLPDVLDNNTTVCNFKNESALDGDLLMLDTNITLTTTGDNTLVGCDQTCLDITQTFFNEVSSQNIDPNKTEPNINSHVSFLQTDAESMIHSLELLKDENCKLKALVNKLTAVKDLASKVDAQSSPIKLDTSDDDTMSTCTKCNFDKNKTVNENIENVQRLTAKLEKLQNEKYDLEQKYNDLVVEIPKTDSLVSKLNLLENEHKFKCEEITKLSKQLSTKNKELKKILDENDSLSTQVMESISETDELNKELEKIKVENSRLVEKVNHLEYTKQELLKCRKCDSDRTEIIHSGPNADSPHAKLNRSLSDSDTSSRFNKICTLQSELYAGRQDCKVLTEHVETIKQHLNCSNISMDLDESIGESNVTLPKNASQNSQSAVCNMPDIQEEITIDIYTADLTDCYNYYLEVTGEDKENICKDIKMIDILKLFYNNLLEKHGAEIEKLVNKIQGFEDSRDILQSDVNCLTSRCEALSSTLEEKEKSLEKVEKLLSEVKSNIKRINNDISNLKQGDDVVKIINKFKQNFLKTLDYEFGTSSTSVFEILFEKYQEELVKFKQQYTQDVDKSQLNESRDTAKTLLELQSVLAEKESECNLLKAQKEKMLEISSAVTLEVVRKENDIMKFLSEGCSKLFEHNLISSNLTLSGSALDNINIIFEDILNNYKSAHPQQQQADFERISFELNKAKQFLDIQERELVELKAQNESLRDVNNNVLLDLAEKEDKILKLKIAHDELSKAYDAKMQENCNRLSELDKLAEEINLLKEKSKNSESITSVLAERDSKITELLQSVDELQQSNGNLKTELNKLNEELKQIKLCTSALNEKETELTKFQSLVKELQEANAQLTGEILSLKDTIIKKESLISSLSEKNAKTTELSQTVRELQEDNERLVSINQMISQERQSYSIDLEKSSETIKQNNSQIETMTADILVLRESIKDATSTIESLKQDVQRLTTQKVKLESSLEEKKRECVRLEMNIKTHDKTAELQSKMIMRLKKQKEEDDRAISESQAKVTEVCEKYTMLQNECETLKHTILSLEAHVSELQAVADKPRLSAECGADTRRRRQSTHDSRRQLRHLEEQRDLEEMFSSRQKSDDFFADDSSGRSTPFGLGKGRESLLSRTDQSDKDEDASSRPSSVQLARRRRQSTHDLHRGVPPHTHTPSPHDLSSRIPDELHDTKDSSANRSDSKKDNSEVSVLRNQLTSCKTELAELQERYKELDDECETCATYLRESEDKCRQLKKEKAELEKQILELKASSSNSGHKLSVASVAVNTDEDWANLHAVVVDRMSFDAEVDKNKKLARCVDELRCQKQELKNTLAKMQRALEKQHAARDHRELDATKKELKSVKAELEELKEKYKELDEECETCSQYLKEREEQCRRLKEAKATLECKLQELQEDSHALAHYSLRKKRQTLHDLHRGSAAEHSDAATDTREDLLSSQAERDDCSEKTQDDKMREIKRLRMIVEKLSHQKQALELQMKATSAQPMYVATGSAIVQNQQITDVMKENQRLKKINAKLVNICKKRGKSDANRENEDPCEQG